MLSGHIKSTGHPSGGPLRPKAPSVFTALVRRIPYTTDLSNRRSLGPKAKVLLLMTQILHDSIYKNSENYSSIVPIGSCRICIINRASLQNGNRGLQQETCLCNTHPSHLLGPDSAPRSWGSDSKQLPTRVPCSLLVPVLLICST